MSALQIKLNCKRFGLGVFSGMIGGTTSILILSQRATWMVNGLAAEPTPAGWILIAIFGAIFGGVTAGVAFGLTWKFIQKLPLKIQLLSLIIAGFILGSILSLFFIPFSAPIPLQLKK